MKEIFTRHMAGAMRVSAYFSDHYPMLSDDFHDAVTDVLLRLDRMDIEPDYPETFVQHCVRNACRTVCRKVRMPSHSTRMACSIDIDIPDSWNSIEEMESAEFASSIREKLRKHLPEPQYRAICLVDLEEEGKWGKKRAKQLGITYKTVHHQRTRGVQRAREVLAGAV